MTTRAHRCKCGKIRHVSRLILFQPLHYNSHNRRTFTLFTFLYRIIKNKKQQKAPHCEKTLLYTIMATTKPQPFQKLLTSSAPYGIISRLTKPFVTNFGCGEVPKRPKGLPC